VSDETLHVLPVADVVEHELSDECICGPETRPVERDDGSIGWVCVHHSLDAREQREAVLGARLPPRTSRLRALASAEKKRPG
jgi:hypothetical protein